MWRGYDTRKFMYMYTGTCTCICTHTCTHVHVHGIVKITFFWGCSPVTKDMLSHWGYNRLYFAIQSVVVFSSLLPWIAVHYPCDCLCTCTHFFPFMGTKVSFLCCCIIDSSVNTNPMNSSYMHNLCLMNNYQYSWPWTYIGENYWIAGSAPNYPVKLYLH